MLKICSLLITKKDFFLYSLRTSESNYLNESYSFYQAIQTRSYYSKVNKEDKY